MILHDKITGQPMSGAQAKVLLQEAFLKPMRWEKEWAKMSPGLRKKHEGAQIVAWEDREEYVMGDALPQGAFARAEEYIESSELINPAEPLTWGGLAGVYGVPIFIAPAMAISAKHVVLVPMKAVREADKGAEEPRMGRAKRASGHSSILTPSAILAHSSMDGETENGGTENGGTENGGTENGGTENGGTENGGMVEGFAEDVEPFVYDLARWKALLAALLSKPDAIRADGPWKPLMGMWWCAMRHLLPKEVYVVMKGEMDRDENERRIGLRWSFLALAALALCKENDVEMDKALAECEAALGMPAARE
jgi:hypothetical protein